MNVYEKLNLARVKFQSENIKMSGKNSFAGYSYYELADILPVINRLASEIKFSVVVKYDKDLAYLEFVDTENPNDIILFTSPMAGASLKGCHEVQNLGATETYVKRYLYQACFEIVESDCLDATMNPNQTPTPQQTPQKKTYQKKQTAPQNTPQQYNELQQAVVDYVNSGVLTGKGADKAMFYVNNNNTKGMQDVIAFCKGVENGGN